MLPLPAAVKRVLIIFHSIHFVVCSTTKSSTALTVLATLPKQAFDDAIAELDALALSEVVYKDSALIMQLLSTLWSSNAGIR